MKNILRLLAALALCLLLAAPALAAQEGYYTYEYSEEWGGAEITGYTGNETNIVVPSKLGGYDVVSFNTWGNDSFSSKTTLRLPQTIRYISGEIIAARVMFRKSRRNSVHFSQRTVIIPISAFYVLYNRGRSRNHLPLSFSGLSSPEPLDKNIFKGRCPQGS